MFDSFALSAKGSLNYEENGLLTSLCDLIGHTESASKVIANQQAIITEIVLNNHMIIQECLDKLGSVKTPVMLLFINVKSNKPGITHALAHKDNDTTKKGCLLGLLSNTYTNQEMPNTISLPSGSALVIDTQPSSTA